MTKREQEIIEARARLRELVRPGETVYTILRHVSRSGMMRHVSPVLVPNGRNIDRPYHIDHLAATALGLKLAEREGVKLGGCGMDMGFHLVYSLSRFMFPDGFDCIGEHCPANDHVNARSSHCPVCGAERLCVECGQAKQTPIHEEWNAEAERRGDHDFTPPEATFKRGYHAVCSQECVDRPWRHADGGYALNHKWL